MYVPRNRIEALGLRRGLPMIFVHTPKCGGSYIAHAIGEKRERRCFTRKHPALKGHKTYMEYKTAMIPLGIDIDDFITFSVIRDPWSWHVSLYHYVKGLTGVDQRKNQKLHAIMNKLSFSEYLVWLENMEDEFHDSYNAKNVCDWVIDDKGEIAVDFILRQEKLDEDLRLFNEEYGILLNIPKKPVNTSKHKAYQKYYSPAEVDYIAKRHKRDIDLFGYAFDG
ncbi:MAG: sulfotransferase family 2 domain-containing protein [Rhodobacter sp.]|nr:sulfotransferase family 2 domain-containing protein [Rhodobacter sp.]